MAAPGDEVAARVEGLSPAQVRRIVEQLWYHSTRPGRSARLADRLPGHGSGGHPGRPGASALAEYRRRRALEWAAYRRTLPWRAAVLAAAGVACGAGLAALGAARLAAWGGLAAAGVAAVPLWFRVSPESEAWKRRAESERQTARLLRPLERAGYTVLHDLALPGAAANLDHLVIGATGVWAIDSRCYAGCLVAGADGTLWHGCRPLDRELATLWRQAGSVQTALDAGGAVPVTPVLCVHGADLPWRRPIVASGVPVVPACGLARALRQEPELAPEEVAWLAEAARRAFRPTA